MLFWACQRTKRPWSLALIVTDNQSEGCWAEIYPVGVMRFWACQRTKKPLRLGSHPDRQPERGALGLESTPPGWCVIWAWQRSKSPCELRHLSLQNLSPQKYTFGEIATPQSERLLLSGTTSSDRGRIRNSPEDGVPCPALPGTSKRVVLMAKARIGYLVVFLGRNSPRVWAKTVGSERVSPRRTRPLAERPWSLVPAAGQPEYRFLQGSGVDLPRQCDVYLGLATLEKTLELSSHCDRQPEWGVLGWNLPRRCDAFLGLSTHEKAPAA